jgi:putative ATP-binding cassette transporter
MLDEDRSPSSTRPVPAGTGVEREAALAQRDDGRDRYTDLTEPAGDSDGAERRGESLWRELLLLLREMLAGRRGWPMLRLWLAIVAVLIANMFGQVRLNQWNGAFFDAVEKRDGDAFVWQLGVFLLIVAVLLVLVVAQTWLQERFKIRFRERLTQVLLDAWLRPNRAYQLAMMGEAGAQPDQRIQEDCRLFSELSTELGVGMLNALLLLVSFIGVLWTLSSQATFLFEGREIVIPGYMVWIAIGYAGIGSGLTFLVGRPLIGLNTQRYAREAELRFALVRVNESAESVALYSGEQGERRSLDHFVDSVLTATRRLSGALARLTWITSGYGWLAIVVPILAAAPGYFSDRLSFGGLMMVVGAFNQVQAALRYFVDNFPKIADWRSAVLRIATFREATSALDQVIEENSRITIRRHPNNCLAFENLSIALHDGSIIIEDATAEVAEGERVLITGESGSGKSTLFRAIAGLWPWGSGTIETPPPTTLMFLPQRPYLPLGTLRDAICYPASPGTFSDAVVGAAMTRCGLGELIEALDQKASALTQSGDSQSG